MLVLGSGIVARRYVALARSGVQGPAQVIGCLDDDPAPFGEDAPPVIGRIDDLDRVLVEQRIDRVVVSFTRRSDSEILPLLRRCEAAGVAIDVVPRFFEVLDLEGRVRTLGGLPLMTIGRTQLRPWQRMVKRFVDIVASLVTLAVALPLFLVVATAIVLEDGGPVFYCAPRIGRNGLPFKMWKFRSMVKDADLHQLATTQALLDGQLKPRGDPRVTRVGRFIRRYSIDELPQLFNVLLGQMSLVGPEADTGPRGGEVAGLAAGTARRASGHHRPLAGQRPQRPAMGGAAAARLLVRPLLERHVRPANHGSHTAGRRDQTRSVLRDDAEARP